MQGEQCAAYDKSTEGTGMCQANGKPCEFADGAEACKHFLTRKEVHEIINRILTPKG